MSKDALEKLPDGWRWVKLGEVCRVASGSTPATGIEDFWNGDICWITPTDLGKLVEKKICSSSRYISKIGYDSSGTELVPPGSVVISSRAPIGHLGIAKVPLCTNQGCKSFIPTESIDSDYLYFALKKSIPILQSLGSGATFTEISKSQLASFKIPLPPLPEQKRIAAILNEQMAAVEKARAAAEAQREAARALSSAYLRKVFKYRTGDKLPQGWRWVRLGEIGEFLSGGTPAKEEAKYWNGNIPFVTGADITELYISGNNARAFLTEEGLNSGKTAVCQKGTVLFVTRTRVGRIGITNCLLGASQDLSPYICSGKILPEFLCRYINNISEYLIVNCRGATIKGLTRDFVENISIPLPTLSEQRRLATILNEQMAETEKLNESVTGQLGTIKYLPAVLLRQALGGEL